MKCKDCGSKDIGAYTDKIVEVRFIEQKGWEEYDIVSGSGHIYDYFCLECQSENISGTN